MKNFKTFYINLSTLLLLAIIVLCSCSINGNRELDLYIGLKKVVTVVPKSSSEIISSPFGIQAGTLVDSLVARAAMIGVKWTRLGASWPAIEKEKGVYPAMELWEVINKYNPALELWQGECGYPSHSFCGFTHGRLSHGAGGKK